MSTPVFAMLIEIKPDDIPSKPISMNDPEFGALYKKYEGREVTCHSRSGHTFGWLQWMSQELKLSGVSYINDLYAVLDRSMCARAIHDIDLLLKHFHDNPKFVDDMFKEGLSPDEVLSILTLSDDELLQLAGPDGDNFYNCVSYLREQRHFLGSIQTGCVALHLQSS